MNLKNTYQLVSPKWEYSELSLADILALSPKTILFFYPRDNTPGCTVENKDFSCMIDQYSELWIKLVWVSQDSLGSHEKFISDHNLQVDLISDPNFTLHKELGAYGEKNNYGKIVTGVIRSTFLFDREGNILQQWKNVRAKWHAEKVLREIEK